MRNKKRRNFRIIRHPFKNKSGAIIRKSDCRTALAEIEGFEPPIRRRMQVFKTGVIDHSTISPRGWKRVGMYRLVNAGAKVVDLCETTKFCGLFFLFCPTFVGKRVGKGVSGTTVGLGTSACQPFASVLTNDSARSRVSSFPTSRSWRSSASWPRISSRSQFCR